MNRLVLALGLVGSTFAFPAAADEPLTPAPLIEAPPPLLTAPDSADPAAEGPTSSPVEEAVAEEESPRAAGPGLRVARIAVGTLAAASIGLVAGLGIGYASYVLLCGTGGCNGWNSLGAGLVGIALGGVGLVGGTPVGALFASRLMRGKGSFGWAMVGMAVGATTSWVLLNADSALSGAQVTSTWVLIAAIAAPPMGAALGVELSSWRNEQEAARAEVPRLAPILALGPKGGLIGVAAWF